MRVSASMLTISMPGGGSLEALESRVADDPKDAAAWLVLGAQYYDLGRFDDAVRAYEGATKAAPSAAQGWSALGEAYDRYHAQAIKSRRQARHALAYVLNNWRKHREHEFEPASDWQVDPFSSAASFVGWKEPIEPFPESYTPLPVWEPKTWLLRDGWKMYGLISTRETPGKARAFAE